MKRRDKAREIFDDSVPIGVAREWLRNKLDSPYGAECPACRQHVQRYKRAITFSACRDLVTVHVRYGTDKWFHLPTVLNKKLSLEFTKLQYWGLIESAAPKEKDPRSEGVGWWKITAKGGAFARREIPVERRVYVYNQVCYGAVPGETIYVDEAVGFDYEELMSGQNRGRLRVVQ